MLSVKLEMTKEDGHQTIVLIIDLMGEGLVIPLAHLSKEKSSAIGRWIVLLMPILKLFLPASAEKLGAYHYLQKD